MGSRNTPVSGERMVISVSEEFGVSSTYTLCRIKSVSASSWLDKRFCSSLASVVSPSAVLSTSHWFSQAKITSLFSSNCA